MTVTTRMTGALLLGLGLAATPLSAQNGGAAKAQTYNVSFSFNNDTTYSGTMTLELTNDKVTGKMAIDTPVPVTGTVAGTIKAGELALDYPYDVAGDQPCTGRVTVSAKFDPKRTNAKGTAHAEGCGSPLDGTVTLTQPASAK